MANYVGELRERLKQGSAILDRPKIRLRSLPEMRYLNVIRADGDEVLLESQDGRRERVQTKDFKQLKQADSRLPIVVIGPPREWNITVLPGTWTWDADSNQLGNARGTDVHWSIGGRQNALNPRNGAALTIVKGKDFDQITHQDLKQLEYSNLPIDSDAMPPGTVLAMRTNEGHFVKLRVDRYRDSHDHDFADASVMHDRFKELLLSRPEREDYHIGLEWRLYH